MRLTTIVIPLLVGIIYQLPAFATEKITYTKYLWNGFYNEQTENSSYIHYKHTKIIEFFHTEEVIWALDICRETQKKRGNVSLDVIVSKYKKECDLDALRNYYLPQSITKTEKTRFFLIPMQWYESFGYSLFDTIYKKTYFLGLPDGWKSRTKKINVWFQTGKSGTYFFLNQIGKWGECYAELYLINQQWDTIPQINLCDASTNGKVTKIESFSLLPNKRMSIRYREYLWDYPDGSDAVVVTKEFVVKTTI